MSGHQAAWDLTTKAISGGTGWGLPTSLTPPENQSPAANDSLPGSRVMASDPVIASLGTVET